MLTILSLRLKMDSMKCVIFFVTRAREKQMRVNFVNMNKESVFFQLNKYVILENSASLKKTCAYFLTLC